VFPHIVSSSHYISQRESPRHIARVSVIEKKRIKKNKINIKEQKEKERESEREKNIKLSAIVEIKVRI
jgi:hypothetical protein